MTRYTNEHEWVRIEGTTATVGISNHAQEALGDITYVDLPKAGKVLKAGDMLGSIESVKAASDIFAPLAGTVAEVNTALDGAPETINADAEGEGWICKLSGVNPADIEGLMTPEAYQQFIQ